jgi:cytochrome c peroxidase
LRAKPFAPTGFVTLGLITINALATGLMLIAASNAWADEANTPGNKATPARRLNLPVVPYRYAGIQPPSHAEEAAARFDNMPPDNPITDHGATLGRVLFYDPTLSRNGTKSCASCHHQSAAFTDPAAVSTGFEGGKVTRNSMSLINLRYSPGNRFFWDERAQTLEKQVLMPIENPIEMGHELGQLEQQLATDPIYPPLFRAAFGDESIDRHRIAKGLAQFLRTIVSFDTRYDHGLAVAGSPDKPFPNFTEQENEGKGIFFGEGRCHQCHLANREGSDEKPQTVFFFLDRPTVNGIDSEQPQSPGEKIDPGVGGISGLSADLGRFRSPSLRCVDLTGPYMHDGRLRTLEAVIEHYGWSLRPHANLDRRLHNIVGSGFAFRQSEVEALVAFLKTLTDERLIADPRFADPFLTGDTVAGTTP